VSYTPVRTSTDDQPAAFAPAISAKEDGETARGRMRGSILKLKTRQETAYRTLDCLGTVVRQESIEKMHAGLPPTI